MSITNHPSRGKAGFHPRPFKENSRKALALVNTEKLPVRGRGFSPECPQQPPGHASRNVGSSGKASVCRLPGPRGAAVGHSTPRSACRHPRDGPVGGKAQNVVGPQERRSSEHAKDRANDPLEAEQELQGLVPSALPKLLSGDHVGRRETGKGERNAVWVCFRAFGLTCKKNQPTL